MCHLARSGLTTLESHMESCVIDMRTSTPTSDGSEADVAFTMSRGPAATTGSSI